VNSLEFWQEKIRQFFHDPLGKPYTWYPRSGGHEKVAAELFKRFSGLKDFRYSRPPDWATTGADRAALTQPWGRRQVAVHWPSHPLVTHPLTSGYVLDVRRPAEERPTTEVREAVLAEQRAVADQLGREPEIDTALGDEEETGNEPEEPPEDSAGEELAGALRGARDEMRLRSGFHRLWRRFRDELISRRSRAGDLLWEVMPADSRCPDHSIWDHLRVTTALAFLSYDTRAFNPTPEKLPPAQEPWLLRFGIGPVQRFLEESRSSRDLWVGSYLLSDLIWHAMLPVIERYGPDAILYPDLRGNPMADLWLFDADREALPAGARNPSTFAAVLPNAFVALLPRGAPGEFFVPLDELAREAQERVRARWEELAGVVAAWLEERLGPEPWRQVLPIWSRHHRSPPLYSIWAAVAWEHPGLLRRAESLRGRALPAQRSDFREPPPEAASDARQDKATLASRRRRLAPWLPPRAWARYEQAREVFALTHLPYHQMERGFDYALTHHQLGLRYTLRKEAAPEPQIDDEPGEKCTCCGRRQALYPSPDPGGTGLDSARKAAREFWKVDERLDPEGTGEERLCGVCAVKRFLVEAGRGQSGLIGINRSWAGPATPLEEVADRDGRVRVPFPSTAALAAQAFVADLATDPALEPWVSEVVRAHRRADLSRTSFPRALPRLADAARRATAAGAELLKIEPEEAIFPEAIEGRQRFFARRRDGAKEEAHRQLTKAVRDLRAAARKRFKASGRTPDPGRSIAVLVMDGDRMRRLLRGDEEVVHARWRDVLHPKAVEQTLAHLQHTGWPDLLDAPRLMGPSLHALISRALASFSHRIVPWVVEQEFAGRLIYAGGDDVLCLAPAGDALALAARLQQLFSAAWIIDTGPLADPWAWRRRDWEGEFDPHRARRRFAIPKKPRPGSHLVLPAPPESLELHPARDSDSGSAIEPADGPVLPMLGPGQSLSAGIAIGHYKTPLAALLRQARRLLKEGAKERLGGNALGVSHISRNGVKTEFVLPWGDHDEPLRAHRLLAEVQQGFSPDGSLAGRIPYKLREIAPEAMVAWERVGERPGGREDEKGAERRRWLQALFDGVVEGRRSSAHKAAFELWLRGLQAFPEHPERSVEGLLLCRHLAGREEEAE
jgi:CRISPR-associated protein Cmr2